MYIHVHIQCFFLFAEKVVPYLSSHLLPVLEVFPNRFIFSPNAATR